MISASCLFNHMTILGVNAVQLSPFGCFVLLTNLIEYKIIIETLVRSGQIQIDPNFFYILQDYLGAVMIRLELMFFVAIMMPHQKTKQF